MNRSTHKSTKRILTTNDCKKVPSCVLYGVRPAAGFPTPGDDVIESELDLNEFLVKDETATFFVRVAGNSMEGDRIFDGDILVVDRSLTAGNGSIVVAAVYGELVVKRLVLDKDGSVKLVSAKAGYDPILIGDNEQCFIWGVVTGLVRKLR